MVSYAGWGEFKAEMGLHNKVMPGEFDLKTLAKQYNALLKDMLDLTPVTEIDTEGNVITKGYRVLMTKLHKWIVDQAVLKGKLCHANSVIRNNPSQLNANTIL